MSETVGVVAIQGDYEKHVAALGRISPALRVRRLRVREDVDGVDRVILPGGESTTVGILLQRFGLGPALIEAAGRGMPMWGTCMGLILMAREIRGMPTQYRLGVLDVGVERNAFGSQVHSFESEISILGWKAPHRAVFIRAPAVVDVGQAVEPLAEFDAKVVAVRQGRMLGTAFHPELTEDLRFHEMFLGL